MRIQRIAAPLFLAMALGCSSVTFMAQPQYDGGSGLGITAQTVEYDDDELKLNFVFTNNTDAVMTVNRDLITCVLPDGRVLTRANAEVFGIPTQPMYTIAPRASHDVQVTYKVPENTPQAVLKLDHAIQLNGQPAAFADYVVTQVAK